MQEIPTVPVAAPLLVVAAALVREDGRVCLQQRPPGKQHGGLWEFPGGKVESGEAPRHALARELAEELGIAVDPEALAAVGFAEGPLGQGGSIVILLYACRRWTGEPRCLEAEAIGWHLPGDIAALAMPPLDYPLARALCSVLSTGAF
jgi:8-oxo-dGTP diphosphatase